MGLFSSLTDSLGGFFGGDDQSTTNPAQVWGTQSPFLSNLYNRAQMASYGNQGQNFANQIGQGAQAGFNNQMQGGFQNQQLQQGLQGFGGQQNQALGGAINAGLGQISNNFNENIMPGINAGAAGTNTSGGSRQGIAQGLAAGKANQQATDFVSQMQSNNWGQQMQNQLGAYGQMGGLQGQQNLSQMNAMGMAPELANLGFGSQYGDLSALRGLLGSPTVLGGGGQSSGQGGVGGSLEGAAGIGALAMFSDIRLKENIKRVGETDGGLPVYTYNYKGTQRTHMGVMAQDVEKVIPEAVGDINGYKAVNYSMVR